MNNCFLYDAPPDFPANAMSIWPEKGQTGEAILASLRHEIRFSVRGQVRGIALEIESPSRFQQKR